MTEDLRPRINLPNRRAAETQPFIFRGAAYSVTAGRFPDGGLAEVFIDCQSHGMTPLSDDAKDAAVALSIALQYGAPAEAIRLAVSRTTDGEPTGILGCVLDLLKDSDPT